MHVLQAPHIKPVQSAAPVSMATENGVGDLRGKDPCERAQAIIDNCAHPDYREQLRAYLKVRKEGHALMSLNYALAMHQQFVHSADMRGVQWKVE